MVMTRVGVAKLKAGLSKYLRKVKAGKEVVVYDRDTPIARIVPYTSNQRLGGLVLRQPVSGVRMQDVPLPPPLPMPEGFDIVDLLLDDRRKDRERVP